MQMWSLHERTTEEQARINRGRSNNGKISTMEDTTTSDDAWDVLIRLASRGMVHAPTRPDKSTSGTSECSHGGHDRCICGMDESRG